MTDFKVNILDALLDKYERSGAYRTGEAPTRRFLLRLYSHGNTEFAPYNIERNEARLLVNQAALALKADGIIDLKWLKGEENHIIEAVWLVYDKLDAAYKKARRTPLRDEAEKRQAEIEAFQAQIRTEWILEFVNDTLETIRLNKKVPERENLFKALRFIDTMGETELTQRIFSMKCFGDSKAFEKSVKSKLLSVLRKYIPITEDATEDDILRQIGITKYPEQFDLCGDFQIRFTDTDAVVDYSPLSLGGSIFVSDVKRIKDICLSKINRVITIENRANYFDYIAKHKKDDELVIYHGGQFSPSRKIFFLRFKKAMREDIRWEHWSDIDYGGFLMLLRLRQEISADIKPFRMEAAELRKYMDFCVAIQPTYIEKLKTLLLKTALLDCHDCIRFMMDRQVRLEQESMLTD